MLLFSSQKLLLAGPAHRQIANSKFIDSYADILYQLSHQGSPNSLVGKETINSEEREGKMGTCHEAPENRELKTFQRFEVKGG